MIRSEVLETTWKPTLKNIGEVAIMFEGVMIRTPLENDDRMFKVLKIHA